MWIFFAGISKRRGMLCNARDTLQLCSWEIIRKSAFKREELSQTNKTFWSVWSSVRILFPHFALSDCWRRSSWRQNKTARRIKHNPNQSIGMKSKNANLKQNHWEMWRTISAHIILNHFVEWEKQMPLRFNVEGSFFRIHMQFFHSHTLLTFYEFWTSIHSVFYVPFSSFSFNFNFTMVINFYMHVLLAIFRLKRASLPYHWSWFDQSARICAPIRNISLQHSGFVAVFDYSTEACIHLLKTLWNIGMFGWKRCKCAPTVQHFEIAISNADSI